MALGAGLAVPPPHAGTRGVTIADERHRWSRVKAIFDATLQQPPEARTTFVEEACRDDSGLHADVQSLLAAHETAGSFAERPAMAVLAPAAHAAHGPALDAGREIGPYRIVGPLGTGGMSEVYRALDTELHREVAVKVLPATRSGDPAWSARLQQEARVLASLTHPGIGTISRPAAGRRRAGHRHGAGRGAHARRSAATRTAAAGRGAGRRPPDCGRAGGGAREGRHPLRSQARQREADRGGRRESARLRPGAPGARAGRRQCR